LIKNLSNVQQDAHRIKGAALNLRFDKLGAMMKEIEYRSKNQNGDFGDLIEKSKDEIEVIKNIVKNIF
jgi:HPt (histidine-containing phosphotransfer) domain-containing protein